MKQAALEIYHVNEQLPDTTRDVIIFDSILNNWHEATFWVEEQIWRDIDDNKYFPNQITHWCDFPPVNIVTQPDEWAEYIEVK